MILTFAALLLVAGMAWLFGGAKAGSNPLLHPRLLFASDPLRIWMTTIRRIVLGINKYGAVVVS